MAETSAFSAKDINFYLFNQTPPDDGRPNPGLSNYPIAQPLQNWASILAFLYLVLLTVVASWIAWNLYRYRTTFPINIATPPLVIACTLTLIPMHFSFTHSLLLPMMPCWLHIICVELVYLTFGAVGFSVQVRLYIDHTAQHHMLLGEVNNWFVRHKDITKGFGIDVLVVVASFLVSCYVPILRFATTPSEVLMSPMGDLRCSSLTGPQLFVDVFNRLLLVVVNQWLARFVKDVPEAYPFRENTLRCIKIIGAFAFLQDLPILLKAFASLKADTFNHICWACYLTWSIVMCTTYLACQPTLMLKTAKETENSSNASVRPEDLRRWQVDGDAKSTRMSTSVELYEYLLQTSPERRMQFKNYLVREFCVEAMIYLESSFKLKTGAKESNEWRSLLSAVLTQHIRVGSPMEINISQELRRKALAAEESASSSSSYSEALWKEIDLEVCSMMLDPYNRFVSRKSMVLDPSSSSSDSKPNRNGSLLLGIAGTPAATTKVHAAS